MNYQKTLDYIYRSLPMYQRIGGAAYKADLDNTNLLDAHFGHPHRKFHTIHIAGTNGKGSTSHMIASVLQQAGYKTGLYTSPHLVDFRERIRIDGKKIAKEKVVEFIGRHKELFERIRPSFFEMTVAMAFDYFAGEGIDVAVVEVGMGGRLDSTNIIDPLLSVITNIGYDHVQFLGNSLAEIAAEKAGIIKSNTPVVIGEAVEETKPVFLEKARQMHAPVFFAQELFSILRTDIENGVQLFDIEKKSDGTCIKIGTDLLGHYQQKNVVIVLAALEVLHHQGTLTFSPQDVEQGLLCTSQQTSLQGRWQVLRRKPLVVCDTGHNAEGFACLLPQIRTVPHRKLFMVLGFVSDKDVDKVLSMLPGDARYIFTRASIPRAMDETLLSDRASQHGLKGETAASVKEAYRRALSLAQEDDMVFVGGSTFVVADVLALHEDETDRAERK